MVSPSFSKRHPGQWQKLLLLSESLGLPDQLLEISKPVWGFCYIIYGFGVEGGWEMLLLLRGDSVCVWTYMCMYAILDKREIIIRFPMAFSNNFRIIYPSSFLHPRCWPHSPFFTQTSPPNFSVFQPKPLFLLCLSLGLLPFPLRLCLLLYVSGFFVCSRLYTHI